MTVARDVDLDTPNEPVEVLRQRVGETQAWTRDSLSADESALFYDLSPEANAEIADALRRIEARGLHLQNVEQEDFRIPSFARDVPMLRDRLDHGAGFVVLRGVQVADMSEEQGWIVYWGLGNYLGRVMRQKISGERIDTVSDKVEERKTSLEREEIKSLEEYRQEEEEVQAWDPYRVIDTNEYCKLHTDQAYSNPRTPDYLGLFCRRRAASGGESLVISAYTMHNEILDKHPD